MRISDWSSDVCSSDLIACPGHQDAKRFRRRTRSMSRTPKHAVILCHPKRDSFHGAVADAYCAAVRDRGHEVCLRYIYRIGIDPVLKDIDRPGYPGMTPPQYAGHAVR